MLKFLGLTGALRADAGVVSANPPSTIKVHTANGYGSTNTKIRRFTTVQINNGLPSITYADSAALGGSFTINESGTYAIAYCDLFSVISSNGISLNSSQLTTNIGSISATDRLAVNSSGGVDFATCCAATVVLVAGDIIRAHCNGTTVGTPNATTFIITKVD